MQIGSIKPGIKRWAIFIPKGTTRVLFVTPWGTLWLAPQWFMVTFTKFGREPMKWNWQLRRIKPWSYDN